MVYLALHHVGMSARIIVTIVSLGVALVATHLLVVFIVTAVVIPRLKPDSLWSREVDSYMASVFPGQWGRGDRG
jgi:hypothetical protein